jgi:hypothetical protein
MTKGKSREERKLTAQDYEDTLSAWCDIEKYPTEKDVAAHLGISRTWLRIRLARIKASGTPVPTRSYLKNGGML